MSSKSLGYDLPVLVHGSLQQLKADLNKALASKEGSKAKRHPWRRQIIQGNAASKDRPD